MSYAIQDPALPVSEALVELLSEEWSRFAHAGTWWTGTERISIASEARAARHCALCAERKAAVTPYAVMGRHSARGPLRAPVVDAVHRIVTDPGRLSSKWYTALIDEGVLPEQVVEIAGLVGILTIGDTLARACGGAPVPLPAPRLGEPSRERPPGLSMGNAWVPMVDLEAAEGRYELFYDMVKQMAGFVFNVARALSAVPAEWEAFHRVFLFSYTTHGEVRGDLERPQIELLAASTSAANECFY